MKGKIFNSKAYQIFDYICRLIVLNVMLIICSFSIFLIITSIFDNIKPIYQILILIPTAITLIPSIISVTSTIIGYEVDGNNGIFKEFFGAFKKYFLKTILLSIIIVIAFLLISNSINYFNSAKQNGLGYLIGYLLSLSLLLVFIITIIHIPLVFVYFDGLNIIHYIKLALIFSFKDLGKTLIACVIVVLSIILSYYVSIYLIILAFSLPIFLIVKLTKNNYLKISERNKN